MSFRIVPAQNRPLYSSETRYGFVISNHPRGIEETTTYYKRGDYIASWATYKEAVCAALCLRLDPLTSIKWISYYAPVNNDG